MGSMVVRMQRLQGLVMCRVALSISKVPSESSSWGWRLLKTMFGRNRDISIGSARGLLPWIFWLSSEREDSETTRMGYPSAKLTW